MPINPKVTVIMPVYNGANYIKEAVDSILNQSFKDYEIVVINDGSKDNTEEILDGYGDKIRYFYQNNAGTSVARNLGIREARGEYIAFLDQDDVYFPDKLERCLDYFKLNADVPMVYSNMLVIDQSGKKLYDWLLTKKYFAEGYIYENLLKECFFCPSTVVIKKTLLLEVGGFDESVRGVEDFDLWLKIAKNHKIGLIRETLVKWRWHGKNTSTNSFMMDENRIKVYKKQLLHKDLAPTCINYIKNLIQINYYYVAGQYMARKDLINAAINFQECLKYGRNMKARLYLIDIKYFKNRGFYLLKKLRGNI